MRGRGSVEYRRRPRAGSITTAGLYLAAAAFACSTAAATEVLGEAAVAPVSARDFPAVPSLADLNWVDLPVKLTAQNFVTYNDNVFALPNNVASLPGMKSRGDLYNLTLLGANSKFYLGQQQISLSGLYGFTRYLENTSANSSQYNLNGVVNWQLASRCSGTLAATLSRLPSVAEEQIGVGINEVNLQSFSETAKCLVWGGFSLIANSGVSSSRNSAGQNRLVDSDSKYVSGGVGYDWSALDSSQLLYRHTDRQNPNSGAALALAGLAREVIEDDVSLSYTRIFSRRLTASGTAGLTRIHLLSTGGVGDSTTTAPNFSLSASWRPTEKLSFQATVARSVGAPTSIVANDQVSTSAALSAIYALTPKTTLNANVSVGSATRAFVQTGVATPFLADTRSLLAGLSLSYQMTPFVTGNLNYQYSERRSVGTDVVVNRVTASLNYAPY